MCNEVAFIALVLAPKLYFEASARVNSNPLPITARACAINARARALIGKSCISRAFD